ncbi:PEP-CTERM sorting domain-containing protein [Pseudoduganella chitinolytica]|uniref:PEP-CTERM sorting domain-containing protein n=1 Tax=Pseudoduganella chitinolytica TaxID=34070 RepID=A0ABY8B627_9BURK|nr:PEP-CTERM sorting domain-containing protein [Pseudoduganella chitinolytica]WEF31381.1 PEP-CTERM sorting domain-containing protein [Pseudoduganella chitinolytica]
MLKKMALMAGLAACGIARAEVQHLKVVYQGFHDEIYTQSFQAHLQQIAYFDVDDRNGDGTFSHDEVIEFEWSDVYYTAGSSCTDGGVIWNCLSSFSYTPGSNPSFAATFHVSDDMFPWGVTLVAGQYYRYSTQHGRGEYWTWTPRTRTLVLPAGAPIPAVPEPAQYGMLGLGLAGILATSLRRRRAG